MHCSLFLLSDSDAVSTAVFSFHVCWYSSHIVQYYIRHVVMLFPPQYFHFMCAGIPHTFIIPLVCGDAVSTTVFSLYCAGIPHTLFIIPLVMW